MIEILLQDLPTEIFRHYLFPYLDDIDIFRLGNAGDTRLKEICDNFVEIGKYWEGILLLIIYLELINDCKFYAIS